MIHKAKILLLSLSCVFVAAPEEVKDDFKQQVAKMYEKVKKQSEELDSLAQKIDDTAKTTDQNAIRIDSLKIYFAVFRDAFYTIKDQCVKVSEDLTLSISILSELSMSVVVYSILFLFGSIVSFLICRLLLPEKQYFIARVLRIFAKMSPYILCLLFYYLPIFALGLDIQLPNILNFNVGITKYFYFLSQITAIFLLRNLVIHFLDLLKGSEYFLPTIRPLIINIAIIRIMKITLTSFIIMTELPDITVFAEQMNQIEMSLIFLTITYFVFRLRNLISFRNVHLGSVFKYVSLPIFLSGIFAYISNSNEATLVYKLILSVCILPILNKLYGIIRYYSFNYIKTFKREGYRYIAQIFLLSMRVAKFMLIPVSIMIITAIFDVNLISAIYAFLGPKISYILLIIPFLLLVARILLLFNMYFWKVYEYSHTSVRPFDKQRIQTFVIISKNLTAAFMVMIFIFIFLSLMGLDISPLFQSVGFVSAALSLSLQEFIRDIVNGLFVLYDNSIKVGDLIEFEKKTAIVEVMHIRYIRIRFDDGLLITIPFHKIEIIQNKSRQQSYIILNISFARNVDIEIAENAVQEAFKNIRERPEFKYKILKDIEMRDIAEVTAFSYVVQCRICVQPNSQYKIKRALNREIKAIFDKHGIDLAFPPVANAINVPALSTGDTFPDFQ